MKKNMRAYAGIGARATPSNILDLMYAAAQQLEGELILRSGGAEGADTAFEKGVKKPARKEIYIPWSGFNNRKAEPGVIPASYANLHVANKIAKQHHPAWSNLSGTVQTIMARNTFQLLGQNCDTPSLFVLCWTPDGKAGGGTGQAIRVARHYDIPVFDLGCMTPAKVESSIEALL